MGENQKSLSAEVLLKAREAFETQRRHARYRGIGWELTFTQWLDFWGDDLSKRGQFVGDLHMQRPNDSGPYAIGNIRKGTQRDNAHTRSAVMWNKSKTNAADVLIPDERGEDYLGYSSIWDDSLGVSANAFHKLLVS